MLGSGAAGWRDDPEALLAASIVLDQFSPQHPSRRGGGVRGRPAGAGAARLAIARGWDAGMTVEQRQFLYMPLMHAEDPEAQAECLRCFEATGDANALAYARDHAAVIDRFGRFPGRNEAPGREVHGGGAGVSARAGGVVTRSSSSPRKRG